MKTETEAQDELDPLFVRNKRFSCYVSGPGCICTDFIKIFADRSCQSDSLFPEARSSFLRVSPRIRKQKYDSFVWLLNGHFQTTTKIIISFLSFTSYFLREKYYKTWEV